jgi:hypothetical protein
MPKLRWLERSVQKTTASVGPVAQRLVRDFVIGSYLAGTAILSGIARRLCPKKRGFEAALERLSRGLKKQRDAVGRVLAAYQRRAVAWARRKGFDVLAIDLSEIVKPYGRKLPWLCEVRDGSKSSRAKTVIAQGWWTVEVVATDAEHRVLPLVRRLYSTVHPTFESVQHELAAALAMLQPLLWAGVRAVLDRGFDGDTFFTVLDRYLRDWAVRQKGNRQVYLPGQDKPLRMSTLAKTVSQDHMARPLVVRRGELIRKRQTFGFCTVEVPHTSPRKGRKKPVCRLMSLIVADRHDPLKPPLMLLVNRPVHDVTTARAWVEAYFRRWGAEDETRADKQLGGLEDVRVQSWDSLHSLVALSVVSAGLLALVQVEAPRRAARLARTAPIDGEVPTFALYRIWLSVALLLAGHTRRR